MFLTIRQAQIIINQFNNLNKNQQSQMAATFVNYLLIPFEVIINHADQQELKLYLQATKGMDKIAYKLDISVSYEKSL